MDLGSGSGRRKRGRSPTDDCQECMPISKRIHNLNIRSRGCSTEEEQGEDSEGFSNNNANGCRCSTNGQPQPGPSHAPNLGWPTPGSSLTTNGLPALHDPGGQLNGYPTLLSDGTPDLHHKHSVNVAQGPHTHLTDPAYNPKLNMAANPHYYQSNKLLYNAHLLRLRRHNPPDS